MLGVINYEFLNLEKFLEYLGGFESNVYDFDLLEGLKSGGLESSEENLVLADRNWHKLRYSIISLVELEAPLMEALNILGEVKKKNLARIIEYQDFFLERSLDSLD